MQSLRQIVRRFTAAPKAHLALGVVAAANQLTFVAFAVPFSGLHQTPAVCSASIDGACAAPADQPSGDSTQLALPHGFSLCPRSGPDASCTGSDLRAAGTPGVASLPPGQTACSVDSSLPSTPAACSNTILVPPTSSTATTGAIGDSAAVLPSVPVASLTPATGSERLALDADATTVRSGHMTVLTATATSKVGSGTAIEIFDVTSGSLAGACTNASQCLVAYSASGGVHTFNAFITRPTPKPPVVDGSLQTTAVQSNAVTVGWLGSTISANSSVVGPGHAITFTATSTIDVAREGRWLEIYDITAKKRLTYCSRGTTCTTTVTQSAGGQHEVVGYVTGQPEAVSDPVYVTWLSVSLEASTTSRTAGGHIYLNATTNVDLTTTPWVLAIFDQYGRMVDRACKTGYSCAVQAWVSGETPLYTAEIGALPAASRPTPLTSLLQHLAPTGLTDIQVRSASVQPRRLLWGVDSCKSFTDDWYGRSGLLPQVINGLGSPDFWGRYLTNTVCPGISADEIATAARNHMGILPIYNDYDCSAVSSWATGHAYANAAVNAAESLGIPKGRVLAIDIEPPGDACPGAAGVDSGFIEGWFEGVYGYGYVPVYYGDGTSGSAFASAWCTTISILPNIARNSYLWSFEPSLSGGFSKSSSPDYTPYGPGCPAASAAWQYVLSAGSSPDVDQDEAVSSLPLWYPSS